MIYSDNYIAIGLVRNFAAVRIAAIRPIAKEGLGVKPPERFSGKGD